jgi:sugar phosphate isomerase/epimerase
VRQGPPTRRDVLAGAAIAGAALCTPELAFAHTPALPFPIGLEIYTVGAELMKDFDGTLDAVAAAGYVEIEIPSLYGRTIAQWRAALEKRGLRCDSAHVAATGFGPDMESLENKPDSVLGQMRDLGVRYVPCGLPPMPMAKRPTLDQLKVDLVGSFKRFFASLTLEDWRWIADFMNEKGALAKARGLTLAYHNHATEFRPMDGSSGFDELLRRLDPSVVTIELDCGWAFAGGRDPVQLLRDHPTHFQLLHLKDLNRPTTLTYEGMNAADIGKGMTDWPALLGAAAKAGVKYAYVEQEPPYKSPPLEIVASAQRFLAGVTPRR